MAAADDDVFGGVGAGAVRILAHVDFGGFGSGAFEFDRAANTGGRGGINGRGRGRRRRGGRVVFLRFFFSPARPPCKSPPSGQAPHWCGGFSFLFFSFTFREI